MKPRLSAVLALVGWYLMTPPMDSHVRIIRNAPLSRWDIMGSYDSADACRDKADEAAAFAARGMTEQHLQPNDPAAQPFLDEMKSICVATDDPRLR